MAVLAVSGVTIPWTWLVILPVIALMVGLRQYALPTINTLKHIHASSKIYHYHANCKMIKMTLFLTIDIAFHRLLHCLFEHGKNTDSC